MLKYLSVKIEVEQGGVHCDWHHQQTRQPWPCLAQTGPFWNWDWDRCAHCTRQISGTWKKNEKKTHCFRLRFRESAHPIFSGKISLILFPYFSFEIYPEASKILHKTYQLSEQKQNFTDILMWPRLYAWTEWFLSASSKEVHFRFSNGTSRALETVLLSQGVN